MDEAVQVGDHITGVHSEVGLVVAHVAVVLKGGLGPAHAGVYAALVLLEQTGQITRHCGKWLTAETSTIDTRSDPEAAKRLKAWWFQVGRERFLTESPGVFSYNLFGVSNKDLARLEELQRAHFRELRRIVARSEPVENVAVVNMQLFSLLIPPCEKD